jgi:putative FmdB family regulatory protein
VPIFEYVCLDCRRSFALLVFGGETAKCPACGSDRLEKQLSTFGVGGGAPAGRGSTCGHGGGL